MKFDDLEVFDAYSLLDNEAEAQEFHDVTQLHELIRVLRDERRNKGLTQAQVASLMGTTQSAVSELERGETDPQLSTLMRYARAAGARINFGLEKNAAAESAAT